MEVPAIQSDQGKRMILRSGSNEDIRVADNLAAASQITSNACKALHNPPLQRQERNSAQKLPKDLFVRCRIMPVIDAIKQFPVRDQTNGDP